MGTSALIISFVYNDTLGSMKIQQMKDKHPETLEGRKTPMCQCYVECTTHVTRALVF